MATWIKPITMTYTEYYCGHTEEIGMGLSLSRLCPACMEKEREAEKRVLAYYEKYGEPDESFPKLLEKAMIKERDSRVHLHRLGKQDCERIEYCINGVIRASRYWWFKDRYNSLLYSEEGIKVLANLCVGQFVCTVRAKEWLESWKKLHGWALRGKGILDPYKPYKMTLNWFCLERAGYRTLYDCVFPKRPLWPGLHNRTLYML